MTNTTTTLLREHTLHHGNIVQLHTDGTTLTATLVDGGLVEARFEDVVLGTRRHGDEVHVARFWLDMVKKAVGGGR